MCIISVIIPIYNAVPYLHRCIDSVLTQSYQQIEVVLVDDGSTDGSGTLCDLFQKKDPRIKVIHQPNKGASYARKNGLEWCLGEYITFVDSDDVIEPDYLGEMLHALLEQNTPIAACGIAKHKEGENVAISREKGSCKLLKEEELHHRFFRYEFWGFWGKMYSKHVFDGIYFPQATINEDYVVMAQLFHKHKQMAYVDIPLYHYLIHEISLSNQKLSLRMMEEWTNKLWCYNFYYKNNSKWLKYAEAQAAETCCKLLGCIDGKRKYAIYNHEMRKFLKLHCLSLLCSRHLVTGLKFMIIKRLFYK